MVALREVFKPSTAPPLTGSLFFLPSFFSNHFLPTTFSTPLRGLSTNSSPVLLPRSHIAWKMLEQFPLAMPGSFPAEPDELESVSCIDDTEQAHSATKPTFDWGDWDDWVMEDMEDIHPGDTGASNFDGIFRGDSLQELEDHATLDSSDLFDTSDDIFATIAPHDLHGSPWAVPVRIPALGQATSDARVIDSAQLQKESPEATQDGLPILGLDSNFPSSTPDMENNTPTARSLSQRMADREAVLMACKSATIYDLTGIDDELLQTNTGRKLENDSSRPTPSAAKRKSHPRWLTRKYSKWEELNFRVESITVEDGGSTTRYHRMTWNSLVRENFCVSDVSEIFLRPTNGYPIGFPLKPVGSIFKTSYGQGGQSGEISVTGREVAAHLEDPWNRDLTVSWRY